jgi:hypothetical protein
MIKKDVVWKTSLTWHGSIMYIWIIIFYLNINHVCVLWYVFILTKKQTQFIAIDEILLSEIELSFTFFFKLNSSSQVVSYVASIICGDEVKPLPLFLSHRSAAAAAAHLFELRPSDLSLSFRLFFLRIIICLFQTKPNQRKFPPSSSRCFKQVVAASSAQF